jgi:hypothetical protein
MGINGNSGGEKEKQGVRREIFHNGFANITSQPTFYFFIGSALTVKKSFIFLEVVDFWITLLK